jgi:mono/diheme cytochrome c family protein
MLLSLPACEWFTDFKDQPKVEPWESPAVTIAPRGQPQGSVPTIGMQVPEWQVSYRPFPQVVDSMSGLQNPVPADARSLANGRKYYAINCAVCHGDTGAGNGPATQYGMAQISLLTPITRGRTDGYIWGMIRNGRGLMPNYVRIEEMDRWDVVNYVRGLQAGTVATGPLAPPGVTGDALPGATRLGPTVPARHWLQPPAVQALQPWVENAVPVPTTAPSADRPSGGVADSARRGNQP